MPEMQEQFLASLRLSPRLVKAHQGIPGGPGAESPAFTTDDLADYWLKDCLYEEISERFSPDVWWPR